MSDQSKLLFQQKTSGGLIEIWHKKHQRWLNIDDIEQTRIDTKHPEQLVSPLHQYFLTALLFINSPKTVLLGGLGGGALARYLHNKMPEIKGTAIEIDKTIARLADNYFYFPKKRWSITTTDLQLYKKGIYDYIIIDIAENDFTPDWLISETMLSQLKQQLTENGVLAINLLVTDAKSLSDTLSKIRNTFARRTICVSVPDHKNILIFAFNQQPIYRTINDLKDQSIKLTTIWGFDFSVLLRQLQKDNPKNNGIF